MKQGLLLLGEIVRPWGWRGEVKLLPYAELSEILSGKQEIFLEKDGRVETYGLEGCRFHKSFAVLKLRGCDNFERATALRGWKAAIPRASAPPLPPDTYYHYDILGLEVICEGERRGKVAEIWSTPAQDLYLVREEGGREWLLPAAKGIVQRIDLREGMMHVVLPEGLIDLEEV
jgi:16S rRNA processing protein RimM